MPGDGPRSSPRRTRGRAVGNLFISGRRAGTGWVGILQRPARAGTAVHAGVSRRGPATRTATTAGCEGPRISIQHPAKAGRKDGEAPPGATHGPGRATSSIQARPHRTAAGAQAGDSGPAPSPTRRAPAHGPLVHCRTRGKTARLPSGTGREDTKRAGGRRAAPRQAPRPTLPTTAGPRTGAGSVHGEPEIGRAHV